MRNNGCKAVLRCVQHLVHAALVYREAFAWGGRLLEGLPAGGWWAGVVGTKGPSLHHPFW